VAARRFRLLLPALGVALLVHCAGQVSVAPVVDPKDYPRLAVLPFDTQSIFSTIGHQIADEIIVELVQMAPAFHIIERARIDALLLEHNLEDQGSLSAGPALEAVRLLGVDAILTGSVSISVEDVEHGPEHTERKADGVAVVRLIDAGDGRVLWAKRVESDYAMLTSLYGDVYVWQTDHDLVQEVVQDIAHLIAQCFYPHTERD
jgi:TolB-like protein